jgi:hypothetical protein
MRRVVIGFAVMIAVYSSTGCTGRSAPLPPPGRIAPATPSPEAPPLGSVSLDCSGPIDIVPSPPTPHSSVLEAVGLDTTSTLQVDPTDATDPHRLRAKTWLYVHAGRESTVTVPAGWAAAVSIAWGNHAPVWTTSLHIPACPQPTSGSGQWLAFPGGFSPDKAACVPLDITSGGKTITVHVSLGLPCPS